MIEMFRGRVVDIGQKSVMVEVSGPEAKIEGFIDVCKPYGIKSLARTGTIAMPRRSKSELKPPQAVLKTGFPSDPVLPFFPHKVRYLRIAMKVLASRCPYNIMVCFVIFRDLSSVSGP